MDEIKEYKISKVEDGVGVISFNKSALGGTDAMNFASRISELMEMGCRIVIADLSSLELMNSSGMGMLINSHTSLNKQGAKFALANVPDKIHQLLEMTHLNKVLKIYDDTKTAMDSLK